MECHIDHEENFPNNEKLFSETAVPGPFYVESEWREKCLTMDH